jgi:hypothetical protein
MANQRQPKRCPHCNGLLDAPKLTPEQTVAALKLVQRNRPPIYHWSDSDLDRLRLSLEPGDELSEIFAYSIKILKATGEVTEFVRRDT